VSHYGKVTDEVVEALRRAVESGEFPGVTFEQAMKLALTDGIIPASNLPVDSILRLDDWLRERTGAAGSAG